MKKIRNMQQLREQKALLAARQLQAEKNVRIHWENLKEELKPRNLAADAIDKLSHSTHEKNDHSNLLKNTFTYGLTLLAQKIAGVAEEKILKLMKK